MNKANTEDFGANKKFGSHHFYVLIPVAPREPVQIFEDFGLENPERDDSECRVVLDRSLWTKIRDEARRDFNNRLKAKKISTGSWVTGKVKLDRFLGRELCILAWATEHAVLEECEIICQKWSALRPEERWWLYAKTVAEAGLYNESQRGWRKALYCSLSDGEGIKLQPKTVAKKRVKKKLQEESLLPNLFEGEISSNE